MVWFIGAGSGDPELLTIKAKKIIDESDVIIYAGSLVNKEVLSSAKESAVIYNSASMNLDEVIEVMKDAHEKGLKVARVHTGDPSIYGAHREQMRELDKLGIKYKVVPGVSQTVILTRMEGRTPMPKGESIEELAVHQASMVIFLSISMIEELVEKLCTSYPKNTKVAVVYKASWEDEKRIVSTLENIAEEVKKAGIGKTALVIVGNALGDEFEVSRLYDKHFSHEYRKASV